LVGPAAMSPCGPSSAPSIVGPLINDRRVDKSVSHLKCHMNVEPALAGVTVREVTFTITPRRRSELYLQWPYSALTARKVHLLFRLCQPQTPEKAMKNSQSIESHYRFKSIRGHPALKETTKTLTSHCKVLGSLLRSGVLAHSLSPPVLSSPSLNSRIFPSCPC
jgi:hypothetical protein